MSLVRGPVDKGGPNLRAIEEMETGREVGSGVGRGSGRSE